MGRQANMKVSVSRRSHRDVWETEGAVPLSQKKTVRSSKQPPLQKEPVVLTERLAGGHSSSFGSLMYRKSFTITDRLYCTRVLNK